MIPPKVKIFAWLLIHEKLHTKIRLSKFVQNIDKMCPRCGNGDESQDHLFLNCHHAKMIWNLSSVSPWNSNSMQFGNVINWMETLNSSEVNGLST